MTDYPLENGKSPLGLRFRARCVADMAENFADGVSPEVAVSFAWHWADQRGANFKPCRLNKDDEKKEIDTDAVKARCGPVVEVEEARVEDRIQPQQEGQGG